MKELTEFRKAVRADGIKISQKRAAALFGVSLRCFQYWESGERAFPPSAQLLLQIYQRHGIDLLD
jgi:DNA-binding transcriptional regulator YiaG